MERSYYKIPADLNADIERYSADVAKYLNGTLPAAVFKASRVPRGIYEQRKDGSFMVRVRLAGGLLAAKHGRVLADIARKFGSDMLHVTTRQDIQFHDIKIEDTPEIMRILAKNNLTSKGGGGNTVRNVMACQLSGVCPAEKFNVAPYANAVTDHLISLAGSYNLPRKYKISFSGCGKDCALARMNDLGFIADPKNGKPGFSMYAGGGMGAYSRSADLIKEWIPANDCIKAAEAVRRFFDRHGNRKNKHKARLRFVFDSMTLDAVKTELDDISGTLCGTPSADIKSDIFEPEAKSFEMIKDPASELEHIPQRQAGLSAVPINIPLGFISAADLDALSDIAEQYSAERGMVATRRQHLIITGVSTANLKTVKARLSILGSPAIRTPKSIASFTSCAGASTCRLGLCLARNAAMACAEKLDLSVTGKDDISSLAIHISGCPNACGQHPIAQIGFFGAAERRENHLAPAYKVVFGARSDMPKARLAVLAGTVPARSLPDLVSDLITDYSNNRSGTGFDEYYEKKGRQHFEEIVNRHSTLPAYAEKPEFFKDWGQNDDFSLAGRGAGECGAGVFEVINEDIEKAKKALVIEPGQKALAEPFSALLPAVRALLITRGVDSQKPAEILQAFEKHFIDTGLVDKAYTSTITRARGFLEGWKEALTGSDADIRGILYRVELLFSTLDADLKFHAPEESGTNTQADKPDPSIANRTLDLSGVKCPMNFVKAKMALESMQLGAVLDVILDSGEPIDNVPGSFKGEGQEVISVKDIANGSWKLTIRKKS